MGRIIIQDSGLKGSNRIVLMNDNANIESDRKLKLMIGGNQVILASYGPTYPLIKAYRSDNSGDSYDSLPTGFPKITTTNLSVSANNIFYAITEASTYYTGGVYNGFVYLNVSTDSGQTWNHDISIYFVPNSAAGPGSYIYGSKDGKYLLASSGAYYATGDVVVSTNFGQDVSTKFHGNYWAGCVDATGQNMLMGGKSTAQTKYSNNYGYTWSNFTGLSGADGLGGAVISGDGNYKIVCAGANSKIIIGTDWTTWTTHTLSTTYINSPSVSYDGKYILVVSSNKKQENDNKLFVSNDYGVSFTTVEVSTNMSWNNSAMSADGKYMIAGGGHIEYGSGKVYKSIDYGVTWEEITVMPLSLYADMAMSKNGKYAYVSDASLNISGGGIYHSKDYMNSWVHQFDGSTGSGISINF
jgi:hypothetical protein